MHPPDNYIEESAFNRKLVKRIFEIVKIRMSKVDQEGESIETDAGFNWGTRALNSKNYIDEFNEVSSENIMEDFATFNDKGSDWIFERVVDLQLHTVEMGSTKC